MLNEVVYNYELDSLDLGEFKIDLTSLDKSKEIFDKSIFRNENTDIFIKYLHQLLNENHFFILRNFGKNLNKIIILNFLLSKKIYFSKRMDTSIHTFHLKLKTNELSESLNTYGFHTDFMFQELIPDCVSLQCLIRDPKYPFLGRNYIVNSRDLFLAMINKFSLTEEYLLNLKLPYTFGENTLWVKVFSQYNDKIAIKIHFSYIDLAKLTKEHFIADISIVELLNQVALNLSTDFVLDEGDVVIFSNRYALHKRGECSLNIQSIDNYESRKLNSIRFFT